MELKKTPADGMRDMLPRIVALRTYVMNTILDTYRQFGFSAIETPAVDDIRLFTGGQGGENEKLIFKILKRGEKLNLQKADLQEVDLSDLALRFDLTLPLVRFFANNRDKLPMPFKSIQMGSVWRAERPQKGRFRQFIQCDIDIIGQADFTAEIELIAATTQALTALNFTNFTVKINDRRVLDELAKSFGFQEHKDKFFIIFDKMDKIGIEGVQKELLDNQFPAPRVAEFTDFIQKFVQKTSSEQLDFMAPLLAACPEVLESIKTIIGSIQSLAKDRFAIQFDATLVRGMGYYTGTIFEIQMPEFNSSVAGGGRYDKMIGRFLSKEQIPACGFSIGFERIIQILEDKGFQIPNLQPKIALLYELRTDFEAVFAQAQAWRGEGKTVSLEQKQKNFTKQLDKLAENGFGAFAVYQKDKNLELKELKMR
jgi:histidyl-tRNA synthetase